MSGAFWAVREEETDKFVTDFWSPAATASERLAIRFVDRHPGTYAVEE